jgi:hypothetical protein
MLSNNLNISAELCHGGPLFPLSSQTNEITHRRRYLDVVNFSFKCKKRLTLSFILMNVVENAMLFWNKATHAKQQAIKAFSEVLKFHRVGVI